MSNAQNDYAKLIGMQMTPVQMVDEITALRAALDQERAKASEAAHLLTKTRIWGGMGWHWNPYVEKAHALLSGRGA